MSRHPFDLLMELETADIRLDCAALHMARDVFPDVSLQHYLRVLDDLANEVADRRPGLSAPLRFEAMRAVLCEGHGLTGNADDYYDPENCYLNRVLERGVGIPVSLSIVWIEIGRRLKWPVSGVGFPGHFLVRFDDPERFVIADPFRDGRSLSLEECKELLAEHSRTAKFELDLLEPVDTREVILRLLRNLRSIYAVHHDLRRLENVLRRLLAVEPDRDEYIHDVASLRCEQGDPHGARQELVAWIQSRANFRSTVLDRHLRRIESEIASIN